MTVTNRMAPSDSWNSRIDHGTQATDGMVWSPVMSDPNAARSTRTRATARPTAVPSTTAMRYPMAAIRIVRATASTSVPSDHMSASSRSTAEGGGSR